MMAKIEAIYIARQAGGTMEYLHEASLVAGRGIEGDRYFAEQGTFSDRKSPEPDREVTLIEAEEIEKFNAEEGMSLNFGDMRRNVITRGVRLNELVDHEFSIGSVRLRGIRLCEPCAHLSKLVDKRLLKGMVHRAGLRACILNDGRVQAGDTVSRSG